MAVHETTRIAPALIGLRRALEISINVYNDRRWAMAQRFALPIETIQLPNHAMYSIKITKFIKQKMD